jgi:hypothetical protein
MRNILGDRHAHRFATCATVPTGHHGRPGDRRLCIESADSPRDQPGGYYGYRSGYYRGFNTATIETVNYKQGTLTIDLINAKQKVLAWTATVEGRVSYEAIRDPGPAIDTLVTNMMAPVPEAIK